MIIKRNLLILMILVGSLLYSCGTTADGSQNAEQNELRGRDFYIGMVPSPKTFPETNFEDLINAYEEAGQIGEVAMIWGNPGGIGLYDQLVKNQVVTAVRVYGLKPIITLNFHTIKEIPGKGLQLVIDTPESIPADVSDSQFRLLWVEEAKKIAREFQPEYFSLGNEINDYFLLNAGDVEDYLSLFDQAYREIKEESPGTQVFVVFSYTHLIDNDQWDLLERFTEKVDLVGLTTYPWKHFSSPDEIAADYYARLNEYIDKPIAFTEIGWPSTHSELEQAMFLTRFRELTENNDIEMVNWLFLHEMDITEGIGKSVYSPETGTIALKKSDGTMKEVYKIWENLYRSEQAAEELAGARK